MADDLIPMKCPLEILQALESSLTRFGPAEGAPDWLVAGVWLCCGVSAFFATASVEVLADGYLARPLVIDRTNEVITEIEEALPDIESRLISRGSSVRLPESLGPPEPPKSLEEWPSAPYSMSVLLRVAKSALLVHRIACALLFRSQSGRALLVGTDRTTLAMFVSEDEELIDRYRSQCEEASFGDYRKLVGA